MGHAFNTCLRAFPRELSNGGACKQGKNERLGKHVAKKANGQMSDKKEGTTSEAKSAMRVSQTSNTEHMNLSKIVER